MIIRNDAASFGSILTFCAPADSMADLGRALRQAAGKRPVRSWFARDGMLPVETLFELSLATRSTVRRLFAPEYAIEALPEGFLLNYWELRSLLSVLSRPARVPVAPLPDVLEPAPTPAAPPDIFKPEEPQRAWFVYRAGATDQAWQSVLSRSDVKNGTCALPDRQGAWVQNGRQIRMTLIHLGDGAEPARHTVAAVLRRRSGNWVLTGVDWPDDVEPGVIVTLDRSADGTVVAARTTLLAQPVRRDGVTFRHQHDPRTVTRQHAPGEDQVGEIPRLSPEAQVLRTLRILGYLSDDGSVILAEDALIANCRRLRMTADEQRIDDVVRIMVAEQRISRVRGSVDGEGRPHHPARAHQKSVQLLRFTPTVELLARRGTGRSGDSMSGRRGHQVSGFVRRLPVGANASDEQTALHEEAVHAAEIVDRPLTPGHTFVRSHRRHGQPRDH